MFLERFTEITGRREGRRRRRTLSRSLVSHLSNLRIGSFAGVHKLYIFSVVPIGIWHGMAWQRRNEGETMLLTAWHLMFTYFIYLHSVVTQVPDERRWCVAYLCHIYVGMWYELNWMRAAAAATSVLYLIMQIIWQRLKKRKYRKTYLMVSARSRSRCFRWSAIAWYVLLRSVVRTPIIASSCSNLRTPGFTRRHWQTVSWCT